MIGIISFLTVIIATSAALRYNYVDPRIYSFGLTGMKPGSFFDGEKLTGVYVELIKEVCCRASKRCAAALVPYNKCTDGNFLSPVLDNRWHDVCFGLAATKRRNATYEFSAIHFGELGRPTVIANVNSTVTVDDLRNPRNDIKLLIRTDPIRLKYNGLELFLSEFFVKRENLVGILADTPTKDTDQIIKKLHDLCALDQAKVVGIVTTASIQPEYDFKVIAQLGEPIGVIGLMVRKDEQGILDWWDYALKQFMCSPEYTEFCERMDQKFGPNHLNCPDPSLVDCSDCTVPHRVPGCDCTLEKI